MASDESDFMDYWRRALFVEVRSVFSALVEDGSDSVYSHTA